jgi:putative nucleotidyltransferase with HDIG domain
MTPIDEVIKRIHDLPSLPVVVVELLSSMEQDDIDVHALAGKIALDQALTAKTLRLANSSFYGMPAQVTTIHQAISVLGFHSIRTLVTACALTGSFAAGPGAAFDYQGFWRHAIGVAACARALARPLRLNAETAFTAGLLHDLGTLVLVTRFPAEYAQVEAYRREHDCGSSAAQQAVFGLDHAMIGSALAAYWHFPPAIQQAVAQHHQSPCAGPATPALAVYLGNVLAHALDLSGQDDDQVPELDWPAWQRLGLDHEAGLALCAEAEQLFNDLSQILVR